MSYLVAWLLIVSPVRITFVPSDSCRYEFGEMAELMELYSRQETCRYSNNLLIPFAEEISLAREKYRTVNAYPPMSFAATLPDYKTCMNTRQAWKNRVDLLTLNRCKSDDWASAWKIVNGQYLWWAQATIARHEFSPISDRRKALDYLVHYVQ